MFVRNGQKLGSIIHDRKVAEVEPGSGAEAEPKPGSKAALQAEAEALGLPSEGTKAEIEARIAEMTGQEGIDDGEDGSDG